MKKLFLFFCALILSISLGAQTPKDTIRVVKAYGQWAFIQGDKNLKPLELLDVTKSNPEANKEMKKSIRNYYVMLGLDITGGFAVGYPLGYWLGSGQMLWPVLGTGAGLLALSIPFNQGYIRHAMKAVEIYNRGLL
jgi:hypothetical protein